MTEGFIMDIKIYEMTYKNIKCIAMETNGIRFPYKLEKRVEFVKENILRISYRAMNPSEYGKA